MKKITRMSAAVAAAFGLTLSAASAQDTTQPIQNPPPRESAAGGTVNPGQPGEKAEKQAKEGRLHEVDDLVDAKIRNAQGEDLGQVQEMVVDVNDGSIRYAVVSYGGFLNIGDKLFAVPLKAMTLRHNEDGDSFFVVDIDQQRLENSEGFDKDNWPNLADQNFATAANRTYGIEEEARPSGQAAALYKLSTFDGVKVRGQANRELGEVEKILIDAEKAKVAYLAIEMDDDATTARRDDDALVLVPMSQFALTTRDDSTFLQVNAATDKLQNAPTATEEQLQNVSMHRELRQKIDSHFGVSDRGATTQSDIQTDAATDRDAETTTETLPE
jgi:sporulation protein YlmC with PRC-barrel domain